MSIQNWEHFFKPEVRSSGRTLFTQGKVSINQPSDTEVIAYIRVSTPFKVSLKSKTIASQTIYCDCNCPSGKKDLFCKHIWATLLEAEKRSPDFFENKTDIEKMSSELKNNVFKSKPSVQTNAYEDKQAAFKEKQNEFKKQQKEKQSLYRKVQYQKQKLIKNKLKKNHAEIPQYPHDVELALEYFFKNGFDFRETMTTEIINSGKKKLARIFHPDLGGSHEQTIELNKFADILIKFIK